MNNHDEELIAKQGGGLIQKLYYKVLSPKVIKKLRDSDKYAPDESPVEYFQEKWLGITKLRPKYWTYMSIYGTFRGNYLYDVISHIKTEENFEENIGSQIRNLPQAFEKAENKAFDEDKFLDKLADALRETVYFIKRPKDHVQIYNEIAKNRLIEHIDNDRELFEVTHFVKEYISFAVNNSVPKNFSENVRTENDLKEFSDSSISKFGTTSKHGIMEIIGLATREDNPNVIAICEYADILYYGQVDGVEQDINKAYELYKQAAGIGKSNLPKNAYPLALWSVGHIIFNYNNTRVNLALPKHKPIQEIENWSKLERLQQAYKRAKQAYLIAQIPAAANLIGQIAQLTDDDCKGISKFKKKKRIGDCKDYFEIAKNGGWIYAYNMLANEEMRQLTNGISKKEIWGKHITNYLSNLHEAAVRNEPWAANTLGRAYLEGIKYYDPASKKVKTIVDSEGVKTIDQDGVITLHGSIDHFNIINPFNGQPEIVGSIIDPDRAFYYFMKAYEAYHVFSDRYCGWACANLKCYFSDRLSEEELRDIEAIIEKYSHTEPGILKTANEKRQLPITSYTKKLK